MLVGTIVNNAANVTVQSCVFGVDCESVETTRENVRLFKLIGPIDKIEHIINKTNSVKVGEYGNRRSTKQ